MLKCFGLKVEYPKVIDSVFITMEHMLDKVFHCEDGSIMAMEFDSSGRKDSIVRYLKYAMAVSSDNDFRPVKVVVIYPADCPIPATDKIFRCGCGLFSIEQISLENLIDGENLIKNMEAMVKDNKNPCELDEIVVMLPLAILGQRRKNRFDYCLKALKLIRPFRDEPATVDSRVWSMMFMAVCHDADVQSFLVILREDNVLDNAEMKEFLDIATNGWFHATIEQNKELQQTVEAKIAELAAKDAEMKAELAAKNAEMKAALDAKDAELAAKDAEMNAELAAKTALTAKNAEMKAELAAKDSILAKFMDEVVSKMRANDDKMKAND
jgi:hypothetical protein